MESYYKKAASLSENKLLKKELSIITPSSSNISILSQFSNNKKEETSKKNLNKNVLNNIQLKTPNKTPLKLSANKKTHNNGNMINDRYIPNRVSSNIDVSYHLMYSNTNNNICQQKDTTNTAEGENKIDDIKRKLIIESCNGIPEKTKILQLHNKPRDTNDPIFADNLKTFYNSSINSAKKTVTRPISSSPDRILDAPDFRDDYYLNLMDWSATNNLAVALNRDMYIWNAVTGDITQVFAIDEESSSSEHYVTSCAWIQHKEDVLAVGNTKNVVEIWDVNSQTLIRQMRSHVSRVASLSWNEHILTSGSRSGAIHHHDVRVRNHLVSTLNFHTQEVCGLKWSPDGRYLASGANDNLVAIWDANFLRETRPSHVMRDHIAAVKAVSWCPWQSNIIATGGGTADGHIKLWNIYNGNVMQDVDARSQISCIIWSKYYKELISSHGFQQNQLCLWKYPDMTKICELSGHGNRVLMMALSPDEETIASIGADETLRLWKCFGVEDKNKRKDNSLGVKKSASCASLFRFIR